jgi:DNA-binding transcriptional ArsR family regulator
MAKLSDFITSRVRIKLLQTFLSQPQEMFYVRELTRLVDEEINAVRRELSRMQNAGMVQAEKRGNRLYYQFRPNYPFFTELLSLVTKTTPVGRSIINNRSKLGFVKYAFVSQRLVRGLPRQENELDIVIIGKVIMPQLDQIVKKLEKKLETEINYSSMTEEEFKYRKNRKDPFITDVLLHPHIMLIGSENKLLS